MNTSLISTDRWPFGISGIGILLGITLGIERILLVSDVASAPVGYRASVVTSLPFITGLIYGGYWLANSTLSTERYPRIVGWTVVTLIGFGLLINGIVLTMERAAWHVSATRWAGSIGGSFGLVIGVLEAYIIESRNHAEQVRTQKQELERQNEQLDQFTSVVAHDLRNPLNVAQGRLELVKQECESDHDHLDNVAQAHDRMATLIDDLLTLARSGRPVDDVEPVDLASITEDCWANVTTVQATLTIDTDRTIRADPDRLQQLLENLIRNAIDHGGDEVTVTVGDCDDGFYVADDGPGIPADEREDVFESGYSTTEDGTGFGLQIVTQIAEAHGWHISVTDSEAGGARFEITDIEIVDR